MGIFYHKPRKETTGKSILFSKNKRKMGKPEGANIVYAVYSLDICKTAMYNSAIVFSAVTLHKKTKDNFIRRNLS